MKKLLLVCTLAVFQCASMVGYAQNNPARALQNALGQGSNSNNNLGQNLTNDQLVNGLKETLTLSSQRAISKAAVTDGFFRNADIRIPFPPEAREVERSVRQLGMGGQVDRFVLTLNRAAEEAAKEATPIFIDAVRSISITDGLNILRGNNDAATQFLKSRTNTQLNTRFQPIVKRALDKVNITSAWNPIITRYNRLPGVQRQNPNLEQYVTQRAIDGLFLMVAREEAQIRQNPAATANNIIRQLFGVN